MNTNKTGIRYYTKIFASLHFGRVNAHSSKKFPDNFKEIFKQKQLGNDLKEEF